MIKLGRYGGVSAVLFYECNKLARKSLTREQKEVAGGGCTCFLDRQLNGLVVV